MLAPAACGIQEEGEPGAGEAPAEISETEGGDAEAETTDAEGVAEAGEDAGAADGAELDGEAADAAPTLTAEEVDLIQNFRPPSKGSDDALVTVYEFSDYI